VNLYRLYSEEQKRRETKVSLYASSRLAEAVTWLHVLAGVLEKIRKDIVRYAFHLLAPNEIVASSSYFLVAISLLLVVRNLMDVYG